jgi:serine/threonine-protein kinase
VGLYSKNVSAGGPSTAQPNPPSRQIALNFTGANQLANPAGLAVDNKGTLYVADHDNDRVLTLAAGSGQIRNHIPQFVGTYTLKWPTGVAVDNTGTLYVADSVHNRVLRLAAGTDSTPTEMKEFTGQYSLDGPLAVAVDNRLNVYVADTNHRRVLELAVGSKTPITLAFNDPPLLTPSGVAVVVSQPRCK